MELLKYHPEKHKIGHTYWEYDGKPTHRPIKFKYFVDDDLRIYVVKIDARRESYMKNFGGCYSRVYNGSIVTEEVSNLRLFLSKEAAERYTDTVKEKGFILSEN